MANAKEAKVMRDGILGEVMEKLEGAAFVGRTSEGALFQLGEDFVVVRAIVKSETFDADKALEEFAAKEKVAEEKALAKAKKMTADSAKREKAKEKEGA